MLTAAQYAELMSKVEMLNIVKESNFKLRSDYNDVTTRLQQADAEVNTLLLYSGLPFKEEDVCLVINEYVYCMN